MEKIDVCNRLDGGNEGVVNGRVDGELEELKDEEEEVCRGCLGY